MFDNAFNAYFLLDIQNQFFDAYASQAEIGYYYVPQKCFEESTKCLLHVYFHGCTMSAEVVGTEFITMSGLLEMADANNIVLILPQVYLNYSKLNFGNCFNKRIKMA